MTPEKIINLQDNILTPLSKQQIHSIKPIFEYKFILNEEDKYMSVWLMSFFSKIYFLGFVIPSNKS